MKSDGTKEIERNLRTNNTSRDRLEESFLIERKGCTLCLFKGIACGLKCERRNDKTYKDVIYKKRRKKCISITIVKRLLLKK